MLSRAVSRPLQQPRLLKPSILRDVRLSCRQFSQICTARTSTPRWSPSTSISSLSRPSIGLRAAPISFLRYKSTEAAATPLNAANAPPTGVDTAPTTSFEGGSDLLTGLDPASTAEALATTAGTVSPDSVGYLASYGIHNGFGPTGMMEWVFEHIHVLTGGSSFAATMVLTSGFLRVLFFPLLMKMSDNTARMKELTPLLGPMIQRQKEAMMAGDVMTQQQCRTEMMDAYKRVGVHPAWGLATIVQIPFQIGTFFIVRQMCALPLPPLLDGGFSWITDLTVPDPFFILPAVSAGLLFLNMHWGSVDMPENMRRGWAAKLKYVLPVISFGFLLTMPSMLGIHFVATSFFTLIQSTLFRNEAFRERAGLYPMKPRKVAIPLESHNLSEAALQQIAADKERIATHRKSLVDSNKGGTIMQTLTGQRHGGVMENFMASYKEKAKTQEHKNYEEAVKKQEAKTRKSRGKRI